MEAAVHTYDEVHDPGHEMHEMPTEGRALTGVAVSATLHCLTGCAIGEVSGMAIGTALGFSNLGTIALAVALAFLFGYGLTSLPLLRAGFTIGAVIPIALTADTLSIATMEVVDNLVMVLIPGAMESGLGSLLFWGALSFALAIAFVITVPVNRYLIGRGKGHTVIHETGIHGGPPIPLVAAAVVVAFIFGTTVLVAEVAGGGSAAHGSEPPHDAGAMSAAPHTEDEMTAMTDMNETDEHGGHMTEAEQVRGLTASERGLTLELEQPALRRDEPGRLSFAILDEDGEAVRDFEVEHTKRMHLIVVRTDLTGFQHLHPTIDADGSWSAPITIGEAGGYRVFADFNHDGESLTLAGDLEVAGDWQRRELPAPAKAVSTEDGYEVSLAGSRSSAGRPSELEFQVSRNGRPIEVQPYLGASGHLVALREGDLAFLHTHPEEHEAGASDRAIRFMTEYPSADRYGLFLQFKHDGEVRTAGFTREVSR